MRKETFYSLIIILFFSALIFAVQNEEENKEHIVVNTCLTCHQEEDSMPENFHEEDIHMQEDLSCAGCHGGDPTTEDEDESMSEEKGFVGVPTKAEIPNFCGKCHSDFTFMRKYQTRIATDQVSQFYTSPHGKGLKKGDKNVADCISCHTSHNIFSAKDPRSTVYPLNVPRTCNNCHGKKLLMMNYNLKTDQFKKYSESVHGNALLNKNDIGAPACNDCHGNHGMNAPEAISVSHVCGACHLHNMEYFTESKMGHAFKENDFHGCEQCHGHHAVQKTNDDMVGIDEISTCVNCHEKGEKGYAAADTIRTYLGNLVAKYDSVKTRLEEVQAQGMNDIEISYLLKEIKHNIVKARTLVHTFDQNKVGEETDKGIKIAE